MTTMRSEAIGFVLDYYALFDKLVHINSWRLSDTNYEILGQSHDRIYLFRTIVLRLDRLLNCRTVLIVLENSPYFDIMHSVCPVVTDFWLLVGLRRRLV
jgi:hypothetical protein